VSATEPGWLFPPTGGGVAAGFNDPGLAHFGGAREQSLARETIQNSLDATARLGEPVDVEFELQELDGDWFRKDQLAGAIDACIAGAEDDGKALAALREARRLLERPKLTFLRVADRNTTGLQGQKWRALVKEVGASRHEASGGRVTAGGSWGIGKSAPFTVSPLRTVFYWTRFEQDGAPRELFQGKAVLMSHRSGNEERQGTGFFGLTDGCEALEGGRIPAGIAAVEGASRRGTSLWIAGFPKAGGWQDRIARRVVASFFGAIADGQLRVTLETGAGAEGDILEIARDSLAGWFEQLGGSGAAGDADEVEEARLFWDVLRDGERIDRQIPGLGLCRLWIRVDDDDARLPRKVGLMRKTGMLITTEQAALKQFHGTDRFIAICRFEADEGNALLRQMENPRHDQFEPGHIEDPEQQRQAARALKRATDWIREEVNRHAGRPASVKPTRLSELNRLLPDIRPEEPFGSGAADGGEREPSFGSAPEVKLKPRRRPAPPVPPGEDGDEDDPDGWQREEPPGPRRLRDGPAGGRDRPRQGKRESIPLSDVRVTPAPGRANRYRVDFTPGASGRASLDLMEAGDSAVAVPGDVRVVDPDGGRSRVAMDLTAGQRAGFEIEADGPIDERAWLVRALRPEQRDP